MNLKHAANLHIHLIIENYSNSVHAQIERKRLAYFECKSWVCVCALKCNQQNVQQHM
jgi:hypothetical protein